MNQLMNEEDIRAYVKKALKDAGDPEFGAAARSAYLAFPTLVMLREIALSQLRIVELLEMLTEQGSV